MAITISLTCLNYCHENNDIGCIMLLTNAVSASKISEESYSKLDCISEYIRLSVKWTSTSIPSIVLRDQPMPFSHFQRKTIAFACSNCAPQPFPILPLIVTSHGLCCDVRLASNR